MNDRTVITAALTGPVARKSDHPGLPCSPEEIAEAARASWEAGAAVVHLHLRDKRGEPTADLAVAARVLELVRAACPAIIQLSTGVGLEVPFEARLALLEIAPEAATLNVCTMSFGAGEFRNPPEGVRQMATRMRELDIQPELELYDSGHLDVALALIDEGLVVGPPHFSLVLGVRGGMAATPGNLISLVEKLPAGAHWQAIGIGRSNLAMTTIALAMGGHARTGLEDTLRLERGRAASNHELVRRLGAVSEAIGRPIASVDEARADLALALRA